MTATGKSISEMSLTELHREACRRVEASDLIFRNLLSQSPRPDLPVDGLTVDINDQRAYAEHLRHTGRTLGVLAVALT